MKKTKRSRSNKTDKRRLYVRILGVIWAVCILGSIAGTVIDIFSISCWDESSYKPIPHIGMEYFWTLGLVALVDSVVSTLLRSVRFAKDNSSIKRTAVIQTLEKMQIDKEQFANADEVLPVIRAVFQMKKNLKKYSWEDDNGNTFYMDPFCTIPIENPIFSSYIRKSFLLGNSTNGVYRLAGGGFAYIPSNYNVQLSPVKLISRKNNISEYEIIEAVLVVDLIFPKGDGKKTYVDQNKNTFYEDPECANPIENPIFATRKSILAYDSAENEVDIYRLADGGFAFLQTNFNPDFQEQ